MSPEVTSSSQVVDETNDEGVEVLKVKETSKFEKKRNKCKDQLVQLFREELSGVKPCLKIIAKG